MATTAAPVTAARPLLAHPVRLRSGWLVAGFVAVAVAAFVGASVGPAAISPGRTMLEVLDRVPFVDIDSGLDARQSAIVWELRLPRVALGLLVGAMLSIAGASYQGVFRNPLVDPYLLGAAAGAGLGVTLVIVSGFSRSSSFLDPVPIAAFIGASAAVAIAYVVGGAGGRSVAALVLAGVAVTSFLTAAQTYVQQRESETIREVYSWILGRLTTAGWRDVVLVLPYFVLSTGVLLAHRRALDVLAVGDAEATSLGLSASRVRLAVVVAATLATAAAVSMSGLIGFVGIIVPHTVRLLAGTSFRVILPLSLLFGAAFLAGADVFARTVISPAELPVGVVTAFFGAPFFVLILRSARGTRA